MLSILVVDEDNDIRHIVAFKLRRAGYTVHEATDGRACLASVVIERPDVILLDWMMPRLSGIEVCHILREEMGDSTPIILVTAKAQQRDITCGLAAGADDYIVKPFSPRELLHRVQAVLDAVSV